MDPIKYITQNDRDEQWGLTVCSVGYQKCLPGESYPCGNHNQEYLFQPEKGRILCEYQLLYVAEGEGTLETRTAGKKNVSAGDMFLIHPGEWHTYAPDPEKGWKEYWIGFSGINVDSRVAAGFLSLECPLYNIGYNETVIELYREAIRVAKKQEKYFQQLLAGIVNHLLGLMFMISSNRAQNNTSIPRLMDKARAYMQESVESQLEMPDVAEYLNMGYSSFRHEFKKYTGLSPAQYYINLKIHRAKEILRSSNTSIKEIAFMLHFDSPEYFTTLFKKKTGMNPTKFREQ
jgi:AraC-like DNA-binding protein